MPLTDLLECVLTPCPRWMREMGYLRELLGIRRRRKQWRKAWEPHCENSRRVVLAAAERCRARRKAVVLGSGFLHDVPITELSSAFRQVALVDLLHPVAARWRTRKLRNVRFLTADVGSAAHEVWQAVERRSPLPRAKPEMFLEDGEVDLTVSLNLLSQLPCLPEQYVRAARSHPPEEITAYCRETIRAHLSWLEKLPGVVALITDIEARTVSASGAEMSRHGTLYGVDFPYEGERWIWPLVPRGRTHPHHAEHLVVAGIPDVKEQVTQR
jgi:hypothetical protein